jgi:hypothetical protein
MSQNDVKYINWSRKLCAVSSACETFARLWGGGVPFCWISAGEMRIYKLENYKIMWE